VAEEGGAVVVVEEDKEESDERDEADEDDGVEERALELLRGAVCGVLGVDEVGGGCDSGGGGGGRGEGVDQENHQEHADRHRTHDADDFNAQTFQNARFHSPDF